MKNLSFLLLFLFPVLCFGQKDYCKKIKKTTNDNVTTYKSPDLNYVTVIKQIKDNVIFTLQLHFKDDREHFETYGASIEFEDGTIIKEEGVKVHCVQDKSMVAGSYSSNAISGQYYLEGFFHITKENVEKFTTKKIVMVQLHAASKGISPKNAYKLMKYIQCMVDLR